MSYSNAESKVSDVASLVRRVEHQLNTLLEQSEQVVTMIDRELAGVGTIVDEIDAEAATGDAVWSRLQERKNVVRDEILARRALAVSIRDDLRERLGVNGF